MYQDLLDKKKTLAVIGLGYVGLPIALEFAKKIKVIGFDINAERVEMMRNGIDPSQELDSAAFENCDISFTNSLDELRKANFFIVEYQRLLMSIMYLTLFLCKGQVKRSAK